jgi:hypothetical protein
MDRGGKDQQAMSETYSTATASYTHANWERERGCEPCQGTVEAMLFTDTWVTGEIPKLGPYAFLNTIAHASIRSRRVLRPAVVMRVNHHYNSTAEQSYLPMENDFEHYHGGDYLDEMAALASLFLGARLKAGSVNRHFRNDADRFGRPVQYGGKPEPQLLLEGRLQIPRLSRPVNLNASLEALNSFPERTADETNALIKAARQYQQAIWVADSDPSLAWLMLVSAIETAALEWSSDTTPIEQLELAFPDLVKLIQESACPALLDTVARRLGGLTRSTKKFVDFIVKFAPSPPEKRLPEYMRFLYEPENLRNAARLIYSHRSKSLHTGMAFPLPMCEPPSAQSPDPTPQEVPIGPAMIALGASWKREKTPMLLNTFEHIARGALINWWNSLRSTTSGLN